MKNKLVMLGVSSAGASTLLAMLGVCRFNEWSEVHSTHLVSCAFFIGLFAIMSFIGAKIYKE